jgi:hypothetical protein
MSSLVVFENLVIGANRLPRILQAFLFMNPLDLTDFDVASYEHDSVFSIERNLNNSEQPLCYLEHIFTVVLSNSPLAD